MTRNPLAHCGERVFPNAETRTITFDYCRRDSCATLVAHGAAPDCINGGFLQEHGQRVFTLLCWSQSSPIKQPLHIYEHASKAAQPVLNLPECRNNSVQSPLRVPSQSTSVFLSLGGRSLCCESYYFGNISSQRLRSSR